MKRLLSLLVLVVAPAVASGQTSDVEIRLASTEPQPSPTPSPDPRRSGRITMNFGNSSLSSVLESLGKLAGIKVLFDGDYRDIRVGFTVQDETFDTALRQITLTHQLFAKELDSRTLVIVPDTPNHRRQYDAWVPSRPLASVRDRTPVTLSFTSESLKSIFEALGRAAGVKVLFDSDFRDRRVSVRFEGETFEAALDQLTLTHRLFYKPIDPGAIVIATDTPAIRRRYQEGGVGARPRRLGCGDEAASGSPAPPAPGSAVRFADGLWIGFATRLGSQPVEAPVDALFQPDTQARGRWSVDRIVGDRERRRYVGYRLELRASREGPPFQVAVKPLPEASWARLCGSCPSEAQRTKIARYPEPFELGSGGSFALEVLENTATGEKIVDQVTIVQHPRASENASTGRFKVGFTLLHELDGLAAGVCVQDLRSGEILGGIPRFPIAPRSNNLAFSQNIRTRDGKSVSISVRMSLDAEARMARYTVEIWEDGERVHSEEVLFPVRLT